jgi:DNA-binding GntR family transcriptional regulator
MTQSTRPTREHGALREQVVDQLRTEIIDGVLRPGEPLRTEAIMERFGVSNSPLREAFAQLAAEGLIEVVRNRGAVVAPLTREGAADLLQVSALLWRTAYGWSVPRLRGADLAPVRRAATDFDLSYVSGAITTALLDAQRFDRLVLERCGSEELIRIIDAAQARVDRVRRLLDPATQVQAMAAVTATTLSSASAGDASAAVSAVTDLWNALEASLDRATTGFAT